MTITTTSSSLTVAGDGIKTSFVFNFVADSAADIVVQYVNASGIITTLNPSQYTLTINAPLVNQLWGIGGTVLYPLVGSPIAAGTYLSIQRILPLTQETTVRNQGNFYAQVTEEALDTLEMQIQQTAASLPRAIQIPIIDPSTIITTLPAAAARANMLVGFDNIGDVITVAPTGFTPTPTNLSSYTAKATSGNTTLTFASRFNNSLTIQDFGGVGDGVTDNSSAFAAAVTYINSTGKAIYCPAGQYNFSSVIPAITGNGGFFGDGSSSTYFCHTGTSGNTLTLDGTSGGTNQIIIGIGFRPTKHKTSGSEIILQNNPVFAHIQNVSFAYTYQPIYLAACTVPTIRDVNSLFSYAALGVITMRGTGTGGNLMNGAVLDNIWTGIGPEVSGTAYSSWPSNTVVAIGAQTIANGAIWNCTKNGTTASTGSGPTLGTYINASDPWATQIADGTAGWTFYCNLAACGILIDSYSFYPTLLNCDINAGDFGVLVQDTVNSGTSYPGEIVAYNLFVNQPYRTGVALEAGYGAYLTDPQIGASRIGAGILAQSAWKGALTIKGGYVNSNGLDGITIQAGTDTDISAVQINGNSTSASGVNYGINIASGVSDFLIQNTITGHLPGAGASQNYGIIIYSGCDRFIVMGNKTSGNSNIGVSNASGTSSTKVVTFNI